LLTMNGDGEPGSFDVAMIGGGNMGAALLGGMIDSGRFAPETLAVVEQRDARRQELAEMFPGVAVVPDVPPCSSAVIAVKPDGVAGATAAAVAAGAMRLVSIAAGVTLSTLLDAAGSGGAVVRAMPNTPHTSPSMMSGPLVVR
jgi:pyrroline-5-carboxylate reductase